MAINVIQDGEFYNVSFRYNPTIVSMMHNVPGHQWVPEKKVWKIPVKYLGWLMDEFKGTPFEHDVHIYSSEQIHENATIDSTDLSALAKVDISDIHQYVKEGGKLYQHQLDFLRYAKAKNRQGFLLADAMGCISGDAVIHVNFRKAYQPMTLKELYEHWTKRPQYHADGSYKVRCLRDNTFRLHDVKDVVYSGRKPVYLLTLSNGYSVKATADHEILTDAGFVELQNLHVGDNVMTNGIAVCKGCGSTEKLIISATSRFRGYCRACMYKLRHNPRTVDYAELKDNDGYILCRGTSIPDWHGFTWQRYIYKHRLVMEQHLGRALTQDEVVHHKNGIRDDNRLENLELTTIHDHHRICHDHTMKLYGKNHKSKWGNDVIVVPKSEQVLKIEYVGKEDTYDIKMHSPYHNFVANGIVVHNCGKTLEIINYAIYRQQTDNIKHCLIITCVNAAKYNWKADIHTHTRSEYSGYLLGTRRFKKGPKKGQDRYVTESVNKYEDLCTLHTYGDKSEPELPFFIIMNIQAMQLKAGKHYLIAEKLIELINNQTISMIAIDECHKNMSPQSVQGKLILEIKKRTKQAAQWIPMTGTPIVNKPTDTFTPLKLIDAHDMQSYWHWCQHFVIYGGFGDHEVVGYKNIPKLKEMLSHNMIRRTKEDVLDLPPKNRITVYVESTKYQAELYEQVRADLLPQREFIFRQINPLAQMLKLRQVNGSPELVDPDLVVDKTYFHKNAKLVKLLELLEDITESGEKVIVFSNWVEPLKTLYKFISKKYKVACYTGTMLESQREKHKRVFMTNPEYKIMLGTIGALGTTHTLTAASNIIFYDEPWTAADKEQAEDRIYRVSTTTSVNIYTIITIDTVDDIVHRIVYDKSDMSKYLVDNKLDIRNNPELLTMLLGANPTL